MEEKQWDGIYMKRPDRLPYGISNFKMLRSENNLYVDKTKYIRILESMPKYQFIIRPRRFGKSLFASMLEYYYDLGSGDIFEMLFGDLSIGKNPTALKNSYCILRMSFAAIITSESKDLMIESFDNNVSSAVRIAINRYENLWKNCKEYNRDMTAIESLNLIKELAERNGQKLYLIIDEYDNFANDLIANQRDDLYYELVQSEGYVRAFYKAVKDGTQTGAIERIYMTGVSPILLDDLTSGANMLENITLEKSLNEIMGMTEEEVANSVNLLGLDQKFDPDVLLHDMKEWYNGYKFSKRAEKKVYNTDMVIYFLNKIKMNGYYPDHILDQNAKTDYRKLQTLAMKFDDKKALDDIMKTGKTGVELADRFNLEYMYNNIDNLKSFLFYLGMLTIDKESEKQLELRIPNYVTRTIYWEYFTDNLRNEVKPEQDSLISKVRKMRREGDPAALMQYLEEVLGELSNRDLILFDEKNIKMVLTSLLFIDGIYIIRSENEVREGYADLMLTKDRRYEKYTRYEYMIEIKHIKQAAYDRNPDILDKINQEGRGQLKRYYNDRAARFGFGEEIKLLLLTVIGKNKVYYEEVKKI